MKRIDRFEAVCGNTLPWTRSFLPDGSPKGITYQTIFPGGQGLPQVHFSRYEPNWTERRHRHPEDEVLVIVDGEVTVDDVVYKAPSVFFVGRGTLYGPLTAGPSGVVLCRIAYTEEMIKNSTED